MSRSATLESRIIIDTTQQIGQGGTCYLFAAYDSSNPEKKYLAKQEKPDSPLKDSNGVSSIQNEHMFLSYLDHKKIPKSLGLKYQNSQEYLVIEFMPGETVNKLAGKLNEKQLVEYALQIADILEYIHEKNMVHGDIKPENIILNKQEQSEICYLIDFGLAKYSGTEEENGTGTMGFAAPEQFTGRYYPQTDVFGLGITLKVLASGQNPPYIGWHWQKTQEVNSNISSNFAKIIDKCCHPDYCLRYQSITELKEDLELLSKDTTSPPKNVPLTTPVN